MWLSKSLLFSVLMAAVVPVLAQDCDRAKTPTAPFSRFSDNGDGTLTDKKSGHVWLRCPLGMQWSGASCEGNSLTYSWREMLETIDELNAKGLAGRNDWRLPTVEELSSIVERRCFKPAIDLQAFPYSPESGFWTDSPVEGVQPRVWLIHFLNGNQYIANKNNQSWRVRLIAGNK